MRKIFSITARGFAKPTALPADDAEAGEWQTANRDWWSNHPMTYDWDQRTVAEIGSSEYFDTIDRTLFASAQTYLGRESQPFATLIPYDELPEMDVLEVGIGAGSHAALLARSAKSFTGIDLTDRAVALTRQRFGVFGLPGEVLRMDGEHMTFPDKSFDFIWSWGVIHHSADTSRIVAEMRRVLRPDGKAVVMVYHRSLWWYYMVCGCFQGVRSGQLFRTRSLHKTVQLTMDGAIARFYTPREWGPLAAAAGLPAEWITVYGDKVEMVPLPPGRLKSRLLRSLPDGLARLFLHHLRQGSFLVASHRISADLPCQDRK